MWEFTESLGIQIPEVENTIFEVEYLDGCEYGICPEYISVNSGSVIEFVDKELIDTIDQFYED